MSEYFAYLLESAFCYTNISSDVSVIFAVSVKTNPSYLNVYLWYYLSHRF